MVMNVQEVAMDGCGSGNDMNEGDGVDGGGGALPLPGDEVQQQAPPVTVTNWDACERFLNGDCANRIESISPVARRLTMLLLFGGFAPLVGRRW